MEKSNCSTTAPVTYEQLHDIEPMSEAYCSASQIRVGKKKIAFADSRRITEVSFERGVAHTGQPDFNICVIERRAIMKRCELGHDHETGKRETLYGRIQLSWEHAEQLMEWFQSGTWRQVREAAKLERAAFREFKEQGK